jgi:hypothetical protein
LGKAEVADSAFGHRDQAFPEGRSVESVADGHAFAARFVLAR